MPDKKLKDEIKDLCIQGIVIDGYHKLWCFEQILEKLGFNIDQIKKQENLDNDWEAIIE